MIGEDDIRRIQEELGHLALDAVRIDLEGFVEAMELTASPQSLVAGSSTSAVASAGEWAEMARLLKPFRDHVLGRLSVIREDLEELSGDLVAEDAACPTCGERDVDELTLNADGSVLCATCGRRYRVPANEEEDTNAG